MRRQPQCCRLHPRELLEVSGRSSWGKAGAGGAGEEVGGRQTDTGPHPGWLKLQPRGSKRGSAVSAARSGVGSVRPTPWERHHRGCPSAAGRSRGWWHVGDVPVGPFVPALRRRLSTPWCSAPCAPKVLLGTALDSWKAPLVPHDVPIPTGDKHWCSGRGGPVL